jgi:hypothetical protein
MQDLLAEWTVRWGPVALMWDHFEERRLKASRNNTGDLFKSRFITFVEHTRRKVQFFHLDRLASVDLDDIDLEDLREGWQDALQVMQDVLGRLALAEAIISIRLNDSDL